uniref:PDZ domain-containing protein n=1 Tax=Acrobeloides nanus TaxID=290746 RepID=A0A914C0M2_9BILA
MKFFCIPIFTCKNQIDQLDFSCLGLETVPDEVLKAKRIEELCLNSNAIEQLPHAFFRLSKLRRLELNYNKLRTVPSEIGQFHDLIELDLSKNELSDLPEEIAGCSSLLILDVSTNILPGLPKSIVHLNTLTHLNVSDTSLTQLPNDIHLMTSLKFLDARECEIRYLPENIVELSNLQRLDLGFNTIIELPPNMGKLKNLRELDLEQNMIMNLPEDLLNCISLESLVLSSNSLNDLPEEIGRLENLNELNITQNEISRLPNSIGRIKNLKILKASNNNITELTPAISSADGLEEIELSHNQLRTIPSAIGNLKHLRFLYLSSNKLRDIPTTIGGCVTLGVLNLRNNEIEELPMEVGKLSRLKVLDIVDNNLTYLPYTLTVLKDSLTAIWLSVNQNTQLPKLNVTQDPFTRIKALTCYLLPQRSQSAQARREPNKSCVGGAKVHFDSNLPASEHSIEEEEEEEKKPIGDFQRYDTPHPKQHAPKHQKFLQAQRNSGDFTTIMAGEQKAMETNNDEAQVEMRPLRSVLKRRPVSTVSQTPEIIPTSPENNNLSPTVKTIVVKRGPHGLGWHVAGGIDSDPVTGSDRGIFISKVNPNGAAEEAGLKVGDKILTVNGKNLDNLTHNEAVKIIRESGNVVELVVERNEKDEEKELIFKHENPSCNGSMNSLNASTRALPPTIPQTPARKPSSTELIAVTIKRDVDGSPGFSIQGGIAAEPIRISSITPGGAADQTRKLRVGDRILSVNGQNVKFCRQDQVVTMLTGIENEIYLCVEREIKSAEKAKLTPSRSLPLICQEMSSNAIYELIASAYKRPEATTSSVSKSRSTTHLNFIDEKADTIDLLDIERDALASPKPKPRSISSQQQEALPTAPPKPPFGRLQLDDLQPRATSTPIPKPILVVERNEKDEEKELIFKHENPSCNGSMNSLNASTRALPPTIPQTPARKPSSTELIAVTIKRDVDGSPGFSIQGGIAAEPIRISSITPGGAADQTRKLRVGDRILSVNGQNVKFCRQDQVVTMLTGIENEIYLCVEREIKSAEKAKLTPSRSLPLICQEMSSNAIYELIASAYKRPEATTSSVSKSRSTTHLNFIDEKADTIDLLDIERDALSSPKPKPRSITSQQQEALPTAPPKPPLGRLQLDDLQPRATSTPIPKPIVVQSSSKIPLPAKIPPPVAPKPKVIPETLNFSSKIKKFEEEINAQQSASAAPTNKIRSVPPPPKKPLVSAQDLKSIKADEEARLAKILAQEESFDEDEIAEKLNAPRITEQPFEHLLNDSPVPLTRPASVRTKKAELRAERAAASEKCNLSFTSTTSSLDSSLQNGELDEASSTLSPLERRALELEKKREWRQARLKSIEAASKHADEVMNEIRQLSRLSNISEDLNSLQPSPIPTT